MFCNRHPFISFQNSIIDFSTLTGDTKIKIKPDNENENFTSTIIQTFLNWITVDL